MGELLAVGVHRDYDYAESFTAKIRKHRIEAAFKDTATNDERQNALLVIEDRRPIFKNFLQICGIELVDDDGVNAI